MPTGHEILGILVAIFVIWFVLKLAKVAFRIVLFVILLLIALGVVYYVMR